MKIAIATALLSALDAVTGAPVTDAPTSNGSLPLPPGVNSALQTGATVIAGALGLFLALVYVQPRWFMRLMAWSSHPSVLWCVSTSANVCSLTIDDAPSATTPLLLDILKAHNVKATFFIISSRIAGNEETVARIVREGHRLGNHLTEDRASWLDELHVFERKLKECDRAIRQFQPYDDVAPAAADAKDTNAQDKDAETTRLLDSKDNDSVRPTRWLRPASGWFTTGMREVIAAHGYRICLGSVYPHDAQIKSELLNALHLRTLTTNGSVIIVHDRPWTVGVLRSALPPLTKKLRFVSLDDLTRCADK